MKQKMKRNTLSAAVVIVALALFASMLLIPQTFTDMAPDGHVFTDSTYNAVVNDAGGRNVDHVFQFGYYNGSAWDPTGKVFRWRKRG